LEIEKEKSLIDATRQINKTDFFYEYDRNNVTENGEALHVLGIGHSFKMPSVHASKKEAQIEQMNIRKSNLALYQYTLKGQVTAIYNQIAYQQMLMNIYLEIDSIYNNFLETANKKFVLGESNALEKITAQQKKDEMNLLMKEAIWNIENAYYRLGQILQINTSFNIAADDYTKLPLTAQELESHPLLQYHKSVIQGSVKNAEANNKERLPEINASLFNGINSFNDLELYPGIQAGVSLPLSQKQYRAKLEADNLETEINSLHLQQTETKLTLQKDQLQAKLISIEDRLNLYESTIIATMNQRVELAKKALQGGAINFFQYLNILDDALRSKIKRLELIHEYNQVIINLNYLLN